MRYTLFVAALLAGCSTAPTSEGNSLPPAGSDTCGAAAYQSLVGQDAGVASPLPDPKRTYRLGDPVTKYFVPERLNIKTNDTGTIVAISCG